MSQHPAAPDPLVEFWSVRAPGLFDPWAPPLADAFADGVWMAVWRRVAGFVPLAAFGIGFLFPLLWPGMRDVYTESLIFLILIFTASILSGTAGAMLCLGYILGDLAGGPSGYYSYSGSSLAARFGGMMVMWMLLGIATVVIPQLARRMSEEIGARVREDSKLRLPLQVVLYAMATGLLVFLWCQAMIVLVRPVFTWAGNQPTTEAVEEVQMRWVWIASFAVLAAAARMILEHWARTRSSSAALIEDLERRRWSGPGKRGLYWKRVPLVFRVIASAAVVTLLLAGTFSNVLDAIALFIILAVLKALRSGLLGRVPDAWARTMNRIPVLVRFIVAPAIGFVIANIPLRLFWRFGSLRPVMAGALITVIIFYIVFPGLPRRRAVA